MPTISLSSVVTSHPCLGWVAQNEVLFGVPVEGWYQEVLNSDSEHYGGSNIGSHPGRNAEPVPAQGRPFSIAVNMPPLGAAVFKRM